MKTEFPDRNIYLRRNFACPFEYFNRFDDYQKSVNNYKEEYFFSKLKNACPNNEEIERTKEVFQKFNIENGEDLTKVHLKGDVILLTCLLRKFKKYQLLNVISNHSFPYVYRVLPGYMG